jgi:hypothetical protein
MKKCTKCGVEKPLSEFQKRADRPIGFTSACKVCIKLSQNPEKRRLSWNKWREANPEKRKASKAAWDKANPEKRKLHSYKARVKKYNLSIEEYENMLKQQNQCCAICVEPLDKAEKTHIDHNHHTNKVRGILCHGCNTSLGGFRDSIKILKSAQKYLEKYAEKSD